MSRYGDASYLVSRGVRCLAIVKTVESEESFLENKKVLLERTHPGSIPYILKYENAETFWELGYLSDSWVWDLYLWLKNEEDITYERRAAIIGLLLGYNSSGIGAHIKRLEERGARARWEKNSPALYEAII